MSYIVQETYLYLASASFFIIKRSLNLIFFCVFKYDIIVKIP